MSMKLEDLAAFAIQHGGSDLHLEAGLPAAIRVRGEIVPVGDPLRGTALAEMAREILGEAGWGRFLERKSHDFSRTLAGVRCRVHVFRTSRGVAFAIRLLATFQPNLQRLNLHPDLRDLVRHRHGLLLFSGPAGSGKSSTMAALLHEINLHEPRHIVTIEEPIEFSIRPRRAFVRQREVGRDTPSFEQGVLDALREDPDVLMVGEMRDPSTLRLTLNAAETGHLVLATVHSSNCAEALHRVAGAFPSEIRAAVQSQLADCLRAVVAQRLVWREDLGIRVPEVEILVATDPVRSLIRQGAFFKLRSAMETGVQDGQWSFARYRRWMESRTKWSLPTDARGEAPDTEPAPEVAPEAAAAEPQAEPAPEKESRGKKKTGKDIIVIEPPKESLRDILSELEES